MKAIIVIDMPKNCDECPCYYKEGYRCQVPSVECPLKPMPEKLYVESYRIEDIMPSEFDIDKLTLKIQLDADKLFSVGWNACIEELEK